MSISDGELIVHKDEVINNLKERLAEVERERDAAIEGWDLLLNEVSCLLVEGTEFFPLSKIKKSVLNECKKSHDKLAALRGAVEGE